MKPKTEPKSKRVLQFPKNPFDPDTPSAGEGTPTWGELERMGVASKIRGRPGYTINDERKLYRLQHPPTDLALSGGLWLDPLVPALRNDARQAFEKGDALRFLWCASSRDYFELVFYNLKQLRGRGIYESALIQTISGTSANNRHRLSLLPSLLRLADRNKLLAAGTSLPGPGPFILYRGVAGRTSARHIRGLSWTGRLQVAAWFANRFGEHDPAVYTATVPTEHILAHLGPPDHRDEDEYILMLPDSIKVRRLDVDIAELAAKETARIQADNDEHMAKYREKGKLKGSG